MKPKKVIDSRVRLRTKQLLKAWTTDLKPFFRDYINWYRMEERLTEMPVEELIALAVESDVERMVVCGGNIEDNKHIMELSGSFDEIIPVAGVNLADGIRRAVDSICYYVDADFRAINMTPFMMKLRANNKRLYPIYSFCEQLNIPIIVHGSIHYWRGAYLWDSHPKYLDEVAVDFPEMKLIISHGGNGFGPSVLAVAQRHPNVYLEFSALRPDYMAPEFIHAANTYLKKKCMFGTDYPLIEFAQGIQFWSEAIKEDVLEYFFYKNVQDALFSKPVQFYG